MPSLRLAYHKVLIVLSFALSSWVVRLESQARLSGPFKSSPPWPVHDIRSGWIDNSRKPWPQGGRHNGSRLLHEVSCLPKGVELREALR